MRVEAFFLKLKPPSESFGSCRFLFYVTHFSSGLSKTCFEENFLFGRSSSAIGTQAFRLWITMTMTEKILARASEKPQLSPGDNVWVNVDILMTHDVCGPGSIGIFKKEFGQNAEVWDREKVVIIPDHYIFTSDERANRNVDILRDFCQEQNIKYFYDIKDLSNFKANPDYKGVCHIALAQEGHTRPGEVLLGFVLGTGKLLLKVPPTLRFVLDGEMPHYLLAKDLILQIIGEIGVAGATYKAMEFVGTTVESLNMEERMTLCNMVVEAGGKNGVVPADSTTYKYLELKCWEQS
ncbi:hypothetical protein K1719_026244 [Acacia pycnantha]|nr:hypothetical protein K1719_026244 [Acacia pycnantha]